MKQCHKISMLVCVVLKYLRWIIVGWCLSSSCCPCIIGHNNLPPSLPYFHHSARFTAHAYTTILDSTFSSAVSTTSVLFFFLMHVALPWIPSILPLLTSIPEPQLICCADILKCALGECLSKGSRDKWLGGPWAGEGSTNWIYVYLDIGT